MKVAYGKEGRGLRPSGCPVLAGAVEGVDSTEHAELSDLPTVVRLLCRTVGPRLEATVCAAAAFCCEPCQEFLVAFVSCLNVSGTTIGTKMCGTVDCSNAGGGTPECVSLLTNYTSCVQATCGAYDSNTAAACRSDVLLDGDLSVYPTCPEAEAAICALVACCPSCQDHFDAYLSCGFEYEPANVNNTICTFDCPPATFTPFIAPSDYPCDEQYLALFGCTETLPGPDGALSCLNCWNNLFVPVLPDVVVCSDFESELCESFVSCDCGSCESENVAFRDCWVNYFLGGDVCQVDCTAVTSASGPSAKFLASASVFVIGMMLALDF